MDDMEYIEKELMPEFLRRFKGWNAEYPAERPLGVKAEFHGLHRKVMKLKGPLWDGVDTSEWRESPRTILVEIMGHAMLALCDLDRAEPEESDAPRELEPLVPVEIHDHDGDPRRRVGGNPHPKHPGMSCDAYDFGFKPEIRRKSGHDHYHYDERTGHTNSHPKHRGLSCTEYEDASGKPDATGESAT